MYAATLQKINIQKSVELLYIDTEVSVKEIRKEISLKLAVKADRNECNQDDERSVQ